jgi:hypothetical protein
VNTISRVDKSVFMDSILNKLNKKSFEIERISNGFQKKDPFINHATNDVWFIVKGKLIRNNKKCIKEKL